MVVFESVFYDSSSLFDSISVLKKCEISDVIHIREEHSTI
jgi:hypothetical protein